MNPLSPTELGILHAVRLLRYGRTALATFPGLPEAPSDDPYCAEHGRRFPSHLGCPGCLDALTGAPHPQGVVPMP